MVHNHLGLPPELHGPCGTVAQRYEPSGPLHCALASPHVLLGDGWAVALLAAADPGSCYYRKQQSHQWPERCAPSVVEVRHGRIGSLELTARFDRFSS